MKLNGIVKKMLCNVSPKLATEIMYFYNFKRPLNLKNPQDINEKLQYLKLHTYYENPVITQCVDKYRVRDYLKGKEYEYLLPGFLGGYMAAEEVREDWPKFPEQFVIKCNHGCGYNILVTNKKELDLNQIIKQLIIWMREDFWKIYCEPQYKDIERRIIVEEYLGNDIQTYKFYCFNGKPMVLYISSNGENGEKDLYLDYYDMEWNWLPISLEGHEHAKAKTMKPKNFEKMIDVAENLSLDFPFVRVDLYNLDGRIYFSELTFIPTGGNMKLSPKSVLKEWGSWLQL